MNRNNFARNSLALAVVLALGPMSAAQAQDDAPAPEATTLDQLVVTAQKREEALQDVPITMNVLGEQLLRDTGVRDIKDLQILVPGLSVTSTSNEGQTTARVRGVGTVGDNPGLESSVGIVIDGVYRPRNGVGFGDLGELERIEVLKGPQGTVFGKNTSSGLINVITRRPDHDRAADAEFTIGNYGAVGLAASYNDEFSDSVAFRVYGARRTRDGFLDVETGVGPTPASVQPTTIGIVLAVTAMLDQTMITSPVDRLICHWNVAGLVVLNSKTPSKVT